MPTTSDASSPSRSPMRKLANMRFSVYPVPCGEPSSLPPLLGPPKISVKVTQNLTHRQGDSLTPPSGPPRAPATRGQRPPATYDRRVPTLMLLDGHSLAYRAFFALPTD